VCALRAEPALAEARALDDRLARGEEEPGALVGLPLLVKDVSDVAGMVTTWGSRPHAAAAAATTAALVVARLRAAAAIVVGKTNTPEFAAEGFTANPLHGVTRNPWNRERTPGGSSGGSGSALAAGMAAIASATDGGGSVRIPAAYCGLLGLKPTNGLIARDPQEDRIDPSTSWFEYSTDGPLACHADDLRVLLDVLRGPASGDPSALPAWAGEPPPARVGRVWAIPRWSDVGPLEPEVGSIFDRAVGRFAAMLGVDVEPIAPADLFDGAIDDDWYTVCTAELAHQLGRAWYDAHEADLAPSTRVFLTMGFGVAIEEYVAARKRRLVCARRLATLLGDDGVIVSPTMAMDACPAEGLDEGSDGAAYCTAAQNVTGHPAISLPAGSFPSGVPFGLQVTAPWYRDDLLLDLAQGWEEAEPWPRSAPGFDVFGGEI
jgi:Asp-tRNA(Asn)/Glu-tRNA(Gln) amidotransferase A subunit family amidase